MTTLKLGTATRTIPISRKAEPVTMTVIRLSGSGGELDRESLPYHSATPEAIKAALVALVARSAFDHGDTITIEIDG